MPNFGNADFEAALTTLNGSLMNQVQSGRFTLTEDATAVSITAKIRNTSGTKSYKCLIYRASDLALMAVTEVRSIGVVTASSETFNFLSDVNLAADDYLLCCWSTLTSRTYSDMYYETTGGTSDLMGSTFLTVGGPNPFVSGGAGTQLFAIYCTYTVGLTKLLGHTLEETGGNFGVEDVISGGRFTMPNETGTAQSIKVHLAMDGAPSPAIKMKCLIYKQSDWSLIGETEEITFSTQVQTWQTFSFITKPTLSASIEYLLCLWCESSVGTNIQIRGRLTGGSGTERDSATYGVAPDPLVPTIHNADDLYSIYCLYTVAQSYAQSLSAVITLASDVLKSPKRSLTDIIDPTDTIKKAASRTIVNALTLADAITKVITRTIQEGVIIADTITKTIKRALTEVATLADSAVKSLARAIEDVIILTGDVIKTTLRSLSGVVIVADTIAFLKTFRRTYSEIITSIDSTLKNTTRNISETLILVDSIIRSIGKVVVNTITLIGTALKSITRSLAEAVTPIDSTLKTLSRSLENAITLADSKIISIVRSLSEAIALAGSAIKSTARSLSESAVLNDAITTIKTFFRTLTESLAFVDTITKTTQKVVEETLAFADNIARSVSRTLNQTVSLTDTFEGIKAIIVSIAHLILKSLYGTRNIIYIPKRDQEVKNKTRQFTLYEKVRDFIVKTN